MLMNLHAVSVAIGFLLGLCFYLIVAVIAALMIAKDTDEKNDSLYEKKLKESGYDQDIFY